MFCALILLHELGHYLFARLFHVEIKEFSIGMGPQIFSRISNKTSIKYSIRLLPIGGYVAMVGEDEESDNPDALCNKPVWQRMIITVAGSVSNLIVGFVLMFAVVITSQAIGSTTIADFNENAVSSDYGLRTEDRIVAVGEDKTPTWRNLIYEIGHTGGEAVDVTVIRDGEKVVLNDVNFGEEENEGIKFGTIDFKVYRIQKNFVNVMRESFYSCGLTVKMIWESLIDLISGRYSMDAVSGPVGVTTSIGDAAKQGINSFMYLCAVIAVNLGIFNLLPIPALDGGRLFFQFVELIFRKPINQKFEGLIHFIGIVLLMMLMIIITYKDILKLITG